MRFSILIGVVLLAIFIQIVSPLPQPIEDQVYDEDSQQQQQQELVDSEMLEELSKKLPSKAPDGQMKQPRNDPCLEALVVGPCKARIPKFYFNSVEGKCERFYYGGCQGTKNNFETLLDCEEKCSSHIKRSESLKLGTTDPDLEAVAEICESSAVAEGPSCGALMPRWTFNSSQGKCVQFIYGGCGATKNNYPNKILCKAMCEQYQNQKSHQPKGPNDQQTESKENPICRLAKSVGLCYGIQQKYFFNKENNRCERFEYSGCGGNDNRFNTPEECIRSCGGETPANDVQCTNVDCPWSLYTHYSTLGCKPIYDGQACCPTRFECPDHRNSDNSVRGLRTLRGEEGGTTVTTPVEESIAKCVYKGQSYAIGESVDEASDVGSCRASCFCNGLGPNPKITCANIECPEQLGAIPPGKEGCLPLYKKSSCCAYDFYCPIESGEEQEQVEKPHKCEFEGKEYYEGERIYPKQSSCLRCICKKQFNGSLTSEFCEKIDCGIEIYYSDYLAKGCAPVYFHSEDGDRCCPIYWKCPEEKKSWNVPITILPIEDVNESEPVTPDESGGLVTPSPPITSDPISIMPVEDSISPCPTNAPTHSQKEKWHRRVSHESCQLALAPGDCKGTRPRFYFNNETETCDKFIFTGCNGNANNFVALQDCEKLCKNNVEETTTTTTASPLARTALKPKIEREERSILLSEVDPCTMPMRRGYCRAYFPRYFYSPEENSCKFFIFGGCRGNHNNFYTVDSCEATCMNKIPIADLRTSILTEQQGDSTKVIFGEDVIQVSTTPATLEEPDPCNLPPVTGSCKAFIRRFYYDPQAKYCKHFIFGGCGGNENNFLALRQCELRCSPNAGKNRHTHSVSTLITSETTTTSQDSNTPQPTNGQDTVSRPPHFGFTERCRLPLKVGPCYAHQPSFFYDVSTKSCQPFTYGGCFGNANRFATLAECTKTCTRPVATQATNSEQDSNLFARSGLANAIKPQPTIPPTSEIDEKLFCQLAPEKGDEKCSSHILRYYWDAGAWKCLPFVYTGCQGNKNNFLTESDCLSMCANEPTIEQLTSEGILSCTFGNETYPLGASVQDPTQQHFHYGHQEPPCGVPLCQCLTPPSVTCIQTMCPTPPPPPPTPTTTTTEKICPTPSCGPNCKEATGLDGCPTCDCDQDSTAFHTTQLTLPQPSIKTVKG